MTQISPVALQLPRPEKPEYKAIADELEIQFLSEMLKNAGVGKPRDTFGGGAGEDQFAGFLTAEYARATVNAGGIGLSEAIYQALVRNEVSK
ncbi:MAG: rod-binding protein [Paracoccaceae bacterium]|nr:rod-binding protein [Paracoccaceae bacterium]